MGWRRLRTAGSAATAGCLISLTTLGCGSTVTAGPADFSAAAGVSGPTGASDPSSGTPTSGAAVALPGDASPLEPTQPRAAAPTKPTTVATDVRNTGVGGTASVAHGPISIGIEVSKDATTTTSSVGSKASQGDHTQDVTAVVRYINTHGGIGGRPLHAVIQESDSTQGSFATQAQAACATFTQDNSVVAAMSGSIAVDGLDLLQCLADHHTPFVSATYYPWSQQMFDRYSDYLYAADFLVTDRWGSWIDGLEGLHFFGSSDKIGVITFDSPVYLQLTHDVVGAALARYGRHITDVAALSPLSSDADVGGDASQVSSIVLRFRREGITRVLFVATVATGPFLFMPAAQAQDYHPRYALTSYDKPNFVELNESPQQLTGAAGVGWQPMVDVDAQRDPGGRPGLILCRQIFHGAGISFADRNAERVAMQYCDALMLLRLALARAPSLTPAGIRAGIDQLGASFSSAVALRAAFGPGKHWGASAVRAFVFSSGCECFTYTGPVRNVS